jgi:hypothetical protein
MFVTQSVEAIMHLATFMLYPGDGNGGYGAWIRFTLPNQPTPEFVQWCSKQFRVYQTGEALASGQDAPNVITIFMGNERDPEAMRSRVESVIVGASEFLRVTFAVDDQGIHTRSRTASVPFVGEIDWSSRTSTDASSG